MCKGLTVRMIAVLIFAIFTCLLTAGCSIFDLKSPEPPIIGPGAEDPFNFGDILRIASESAADMDYRDYFRNDVRFVDHALRNIDGRDNVINMLNRLRPLVSHVEWHVENVTPIPGNNQHTINNVPYIVRTTRSDIFYTGIADFRIIRDTDWKIDYWKDMPDGAPFFEQ